MCEATASEAFYQRLLCSCADDESLGRAFRAPRERGVRCSAGNLLPLGPWAQHPQISKVGRRCAIATCAALLVVSAQSLTQTRKPAQPPKEVTPPPAPGVHIANVRGYPELIVDGRSFFVHAAEFSYYRIPRDLWGQSLDKYKELGINTIDLRIPWNWHELREGDFDFDGHSNPRRDLRGLLRMITEKGLCLIARPGPVVGNLWRGGGYPDWLLARPEYQMPARDRIAGLAPPAARVQTTNAGLAAKQWLGNATHMRYAAQWLTAIAQELAPYSSTKKLTLPTEQSADAESKEPKTREIPGPLLFVYLDNEAALDASSSEPGEYWRYIGMLRDALLAGGIAPGIAPRNGSGFAIVAAQAGNGFAAAGPTPGPGVVGGWFMNPEGRAESPDPKNRGMRLTDSDAQSIALLAQSLRTQPQFPGMIASFQAGWFAPALDADAAPSSASNTLLTSRWFMAQGVTGIGYAPLQEGITPPGYQVPSANREYRWGAALDVSGVRQARAPGVGRNAQLLDVWGDFLAAAHPRVDIGLVDWRGALSHARDIVGAAVEKAEGDSSTLFRQVERVAYFSNYPIELVDPMTQSLDSLLHDPVLLLVIPEGLRGKAFLPVKAQAELLEYVQQGGTLVCSPERPEGPLFDAAVRAGTASAAGEGMRVTRVGNGQIIEWSKDFYSWIDPAESFAASHDRPETNWAVTQLRAAARLAGIRAPLVEPREHSVGLLFSELVWNKAAGPLGTPAADCLPHPHCTGGMLSVTNWSSEAPIQETLDIVAPTSDARMADDHGDIELPIEIPPRESLLLPLNIPLCNSTAVATACTDRIVAAGAELVEVAREGRTLELTFYAPSRATILLKFPKAPGQVEIPAHVPETEHDKLEFPERTLEGHYDKKTGIFEVVLPRGPAPSFLRRLKIHLSYVPDVLERAKPPKFHGRGYRYAVTDAVRFPLGGGSSLATEPPLILLDEDQTGRLTLDTENRDDSTISLQATVDGSAHGAESIRLTDQEEKFQTIKLKAAEAITPGPEALLQGELSFTGDKSGDRKTPLRFLPAGDDSPLHYEYDFERSGTNNWVLENKSLRLIFLPAAGGQLTAFVDKPGGFNMTTTVGGLRDMLRMAGPQGRIVDLNFNVPYAPEWLGEKGATAIRLKARWPEGFPISGEILKTVHIVRKDGQDTVEVEYHLHGNSSTSEAGAGGSLPQFVSAFSVPAMPESPEGTQFCFANAATSTTVSPGAGQNAIPSAMQCVGFEASGDSIAVPAEISRIEVRTAGRPTFVVEWAKGRVTIDQKRFSAQILFEFPAPTSVGDSVPMVVRYTVFRSQ